jgi:hypothetical protein
VGQITACGVRSPAGSNGSVQAATSNPANRRMATGFVRRLFRLPWSTAEPVSVACIPETSASFERLMVVSIQRAGASSVTGCVRC